MQNARTHRVGLDPRGAPLAAAIAFVALATTYAALADPSRRSRAALAYALLCVPSAYLIRAAWKHDDRTAVGAVVLLAVLARIPMLTAAPLWSNDAYRYVWDGRLSAAGTDPRSIAPNDRALAGERSSPLWPHVDLRTIPTVYPPAALLLFQLAARLDPNGVRGAKAIALAGDLLALAVLLVTLRRLGLPRGRAALYALHPLVLVSFAQDAHIEAFAVAGIVASLGGGRVARAGGLAAAILTKLYPAILVPVAFVRDRRGALALAALVALAYLPSVVEGNVFGSLRSYVGDQRFNDALSSLLGPPAAAVVLVLAVAVTTVAVRRGAALPGASLAIVTAYLLATPNVLPWYLAVLPALIATLREPFGGPAKPLVVAIAAWTGTVVLAHAAPWYVAPASHAESVVHAIEYAPLYAGLIVWVRTARTAR